jgi:hypothetical protein
MEFKTKFSKSQNLSLIIKTKIKIGKAFKISSHLITLKEFALIWPRQWGHRMNNSIWKITKRKMQKVPI